MRAVLQRVARASVRVEDDTIASIDRGLLVLLAVGARDRAVQAQALASKIAELRIFDDEAGKMNRSIRDVRGEALVVPQFTLYADARRGRRPDFTGAASPADGERLYEAFLGFLRGRDVAVASGRFGARMRVTLENDGPVTIVLTTDGWSEGDIGG
jgi:D-tyrosyl-tRNA(Tyr) deacylase